MHMHTLHGCGLPCRAGPICPMPVSGLLKLPRWPGLRQRPTAQRRLESSLDGATLALWTLWVATCGQLQQHGEVLASAGIP